MKYFDEKGRELPSSQPVEIPMALRREQTVDEKMRQMLAAMFSREAQRNGQETFEEANDFEVEDDDIEDVLSPYEVLDMHFEQPQETVLDTPAPLAKQGERVAQGPADPAPNSEVPPASA